MAITRQVTITDPSRFPYSFSSDVFGAGASVKAFLDAAFGWITQGGPFQARAVGFAADAASAQALDGGTLNDGDEFIVATGASSGWAGYDTGGNAATAAAKVGYFAQYCATSASGPGQTWSADWPSPPPPDTPFWVFIQPLSGWLAWVVNPSQAAWINMPDGSGWQPFNALLPGCPTGVVVQAVDLLTGGLQVASWPITIPGGKALVFGDALLKLTTVTGGTASGTWAATVNDVLGSHTFIAALNPGAMATQGQTGKAAVNALQGPYTSPVTIGVGVATPDPGAGLTAMTLDIAIPYWFV